MHGTGTALGDPIEVNAAVTALAAKGQVYIVKIYDLSCAESFANHRPDTCLMPEMH